MALATGSLTNARTDETLFFQFQPETLEESIQVDWGLELPLSASHEVPFYRGTRSERVPLRLFYTTIPGALNVAGRPFVSGSPSGVSRVEARDDHAVVGGGAPAIPGPSPRPPKQRLSEVERFLKSLCYGATHVFRSGIDPSRILSRSGTPPPLVLFRWPKILELRGHIDSLRVRYVQFDGDDLAPIALMADVDFRELPAGRIRSEDVRTRGSFRFGTRPGPAVAPSAAEPAAVRTVVQSFPTSRTRAPFDVPFVE